ncbi:unnamed protein product [[Actinomadura] parvosata subsp. kistnae]|uniref:hypothetical protein n=1 Tax=[Actinomadura] parvosata TaxID=1955412 RepID=UPI000D2CEEED|nr:unnamed protein product [Actinomadura parvosata subsp. kistnae]
MRPEARDGEPAKTGRGRRRLPGSPREFARRHGWFLAVLAVGAALRALAMLGYRPALWFPDSYTYIVTVFKPRPDLVRPAGYSMFLKLLEPLHAFGAVTAAQHLLGLATGVLVYRAARRVAGRAPRWAATLATVPVLLDAYQIELEHLLVSDTLFMFLVVAAVALCATRRTATVAGIGLLLAAATLTRTVGQPLIVVLAAWFVLRGWIGPSSGGIGPGDGGIRRGGGRRRPVGRGCGRSPCCWPPRWCRSSRTAPGSTSPTSASAWSGRTAPSCTPGRWRSPTAPGWTRRPT